jgi:glyoxylase-like metal-dependent hydrolase (beta-lactamase superfamily II)
MYVIGLPESQDFTLVDCGLMDSAEYKLETLDEIGIKREHLKRVILTHTHIDHIGSLPEFLAAVPHLEVWVHEDEGAALKQSDMRIVFGNSMFESMLRSYYPIPPNFLNVPVHRMLKDGEILNLGGLEFEVLHIPGHSCGSIGLFHRESRMLMSGDTIYADGAIGRYDLESADPAALKQSLLKIASLDVETLLPCHNRVVKRGAGPMVKNTVDQWAMFLS